MRPKAVCLIPVILMSYLLCAIEREKPVITTGSLFEEMVNLEKLSYFPDPAYRTIQFSSFDRRAGMAGGPDWFANADGFGGEPLPNFQKVLQEPDKNGIGRYLIADLNGPGAVVRLWTAAIDGKIKVFIDRSARPVFEGEAQIFFKRPYDLVGNFVKGKNEIFNRVINQRDASYAPIPFARNLRVEWTGNIKEIHFYQLQVRLYQSPCKVKSFTPGDLTTYRKVIRKVSKILSNPDQYLYLKHPSPPPGLNATLQPLESRVVFSARGSQAVEELVIRLKAENLEKALRQTVMHITCDDHPWGQVQCPVGDFFGAAPGINPYQSLCFTVEPDGTMICRYVMPFKSAIKIEMENLGKQKVEIRGSVQLRTYLWKGNSMHFYARWRIDHNLTASNEKVIDLPFLISSGRGVYVGTTSFLLNPSSVPTSWGNWWGEGDEKVFVDNEKQPSIFGTGSEDYYNYSWSSPDIFYHPYCGQPRNDGPGNRGFVTNFRWHILDPIPFQKELRFYMELFHHGNTPGLSYGRTGYCYIQPGCTSDHVPIMPEDVRFLQLPDGWTPVASLGSRNAVFYQAEDLIISSGNAELKKGRLWAGGRLLCWYPGKKKKAEISFKLNFPRAGEKRVYLTAALTPQSGIIKVLLDGKEALVKEKKIQPLDLFRPYRNLLRNFLISSGSYPAGDHIITLKYLGADKAVKKPEIGLDFLWVQRVEK